MSRTRTIVATLATCLLLALPAIADGTVPPTIPHPQITAAKNNGFYFMVKKGTTGGPNYVKLPYLYSTPYVANSGWLPGDRVGYSCMYSLFQHNGKITGRVTVQRLAGTSAYAFLVDAFMAEAQRFYDGSLIPDPEVKGHNDCPPVQQTYTPEQVPDERGKVVFWEGSSISHFGQALEIRDYTTVVPGVPGVTFDVLDVIDQPFQVTAPTTGLQWVNSRVPVLLRENGVPVVILYYDGIGTGQVSEVLVS